MMKVGVNNKYVPYKKRRMTIECRSNVGLMLKRQAIRFGRDYRDRWIISILDYHVKAIVARSRDAQHIPRIDWYVLFHFNMNCARENMQI